jgi:hypothetical protein
MVNSRVERIEQRSDADGVNLALSVLLTGFEKGDPVEITGYATQGQQMVSIYDNRTVDFVSYDGVANLTVNVKAQEQLKPDEEITVVISAAKIWMTVLAKDDADPKPDITAWQAEYYSGEPGQGGQDPNWTDS